MTTQNNLPWIAAEVQLSYKPHRTKNKISGSEDAVMYLRENWPDDLQHRERMYALFISRTGWANLITVSKAG